jgi:hypothetical protein
MKKVHYILIVLLLYVSYCAGSYVAFANKTGYINLERLSQIEQNIFVIESVDANDVQKLRSVALQTIEVELSNIKDAQRELDSYSLYDFFAVPWFLIKYKQDVEKKTISQLRDRLKVLGSEKTVDGDDLKK